MAGSLWEVFLAFFRDRTETTEDDEESRFVPSPLDLSVRFGHGGSDDQGVRELSKIQERAREIEESQHDSVRERE